MNNLIKLIFLINFCVSQISCGPNGAPASTCDSMNPSHTSNEPQTSDSPVNIEVSQWIRSGEPTTIRLVATNSASFKGFLIQARTSTDELIGKFEASDNVKLIDCREISSSAATHTNRELKSQVELTWIPPQTSEIILFNFVVTIVQQYDTFWVKQKSEMLSVIPTSEPEIEPEEPEEGETPESDTTTPRIPDETTTPGQSKLDAIYDGCGVKKICFGVPNNCNAHTNCEIFGAVTEDNLNFMFELLSARNHRYVAMGLSHTRNMGSSSVIECVQNSRISAHSSWTVGYSEAQRSNVDQSIIEMTESSSIDGRIYCKVQRASNSTVRDVLFDLIHGKFFLLLAGGPDISENSVMHHSVKGISYEEIRLTDPKNVELIRSTNTMILIHGSFMIISWIGLSSLGIVFARYFKKSWTKFQMFGKDIWFVWHVLCMCLIWTFTLAGIIIIFVHRGEWSMSVHAIMGCIVLSFTVIQPIGGIFRPKPDSEIRPLFNWLHKAFGNLTHVLAIITIFFATEFSHSGLPYYAFYILAAYVSFYLLMHIIFTSIHICAEIDGTRNKKLGVSKNIPYHVFQKTLLGFFIISIMVFVIVLLLIFILDFDG